MKNAHANLKVMSSGLPYVIYPCELIASLNLQNIVNFGHFQSEKNSFMFPLGLKIEKYTPMVLEHIYSKLEFIYRGDMAQKHGSVFVDF
jgi:hypothetical protein